jgi:hypothetical protein
MRLRGWQEAIVFCAILLASVLGVRAAGPAWKRDMGARLSPGEALEQGECLVDARGALRFCLSPTGCLLLWSGDEVVWRRLQNVDQGSQRALMMQRDGNLVVYENPRGAPVWSTGVVHSGFQITGLYVDENAVTLKTKSGATWWALQNGVDFSVPGAEKFTIDVGVGGTGAASATAHERKSGERLALNLGDHLIPGESIVSQNGAYALTLEYNGALALRSAAGLLWYVASDNAEHHELWLQHDGNLVRYSDVRTTGKSRRSSWATGTDGRAFGATTLRVTDDCDVVLADEANRVLWSSKAAPDHGAHTCEPPSPHSENADQLWNGVDSRVFLLVFMAGIMADFAVMRALRACTCSTTKTHDPPHKAPNKGAKRHSVSHAPMGAHETDTKPPSPALGKT